jgi:hypothetical protein
MNVEHILKTLNRHGTESLLIGGMNFLLNHSGPQTYDVDFFVRDSTENRTRLNAALSELNCEWGPDEARWKALPADPAWLAKQPVFCLTSPHGAIDIFRAVKGLEDGFDACLARAIRHAMPDGEVYFGLGDEDMLRCQLALPDTARKAARVAALQAALGTRLPGAQP